MSKLTKSIVSLALMIPLASTSFGEDRVFAQAKETNAKELRQLDDQLEAARRKHARALLAAQRNLLKAYVEAILRAEDRGDKMLLARLRQEKLALEVKLPTLIDDLGDERLYECVLGQYGRSIRGARYPVVNLRPPNRDLWNDDVQENARGKITFEGIEYIGTAKLVIQADGWYTIDIPKSGTEFRLNGQLVSAGDVELIRGVYTVEIHSHTWGQPSMPYAYAAVSKKGSRATIPLANTGTAIKEFLEQRIDGRRVVEVSGYQPKEVDVQFDSHKPR